MFKVEESWAILQQVQRRFSKDEGRKKGTSFLINKDNCSAEEAVQEEQYDSDGDKKEDRGTTQGENLEEKKVLIMSPTRTMVCLMMNTMQSLHSY